MTQTKHIAIIDCSSSRVIITSCEHNPADDMEVAVHDRLDELGLRYDECSWGEVTEDNEGRVQIETDLLIQVQPIDK